MEAGARERCLPSRQCVGRIRECGTGILHLKFRAQEAGKGSHLGAGALGWALTLATLSTACTRGLVFKQEQTCGIVCKILNAGN